MNPRPDNEHLSAWLDGELDEAEAAELEAELARDPELRAELQSLESVVRLLREEGPAQAPIGFQRRVMARVDEEFPERSSWWAWMRRPGGIPLEGWVLGLAAAAALLLVLPIWRHTSPEGIDLPQQELSPAAVESPRLEVPPLTGPEVAGEGQKGAPVKSDERKVIGRATTDVDSIPKVLRTGEGPVPAPVEIGGTEAPEPAPTPSGVQSPPDPSAYQYVVRSDDAGMKREILAIAGRYGTGATGPDDEPVTDGRMRSGTEELVVSIAGSDLPNFARDLASEGYVVETHNPQDTLIGARVEVRITMQLVGGATGPGEADVPNAARSANEMDAAEDLAPAE